MRVHIVLVEELSQLAVRLPPFIAEGSSPVTRAFCLTRQADRPEPSLLWNACMHVSCQDELRSEKTVIANLREEAARAKERTGTGGQRERELEQLRAEARRMRRVRGVHPEGRGGGAGMDGGGYSAFFAEGIIFAGNHLILRTRW